MTEPASIDLKDQAARREALDTSRSVLVQAPAGSGKTELLTMRFLKLLAEVEEPEEILAITFTVNATAEMKHRVLAKLESARLFSKDGNAPASDDSSMQIAAAALENSKQRGWRLLQQPQRLNIQSIDSLCLRIAHQMPLSAKPGGTLQPTNLAAPLYQRAARKTFDRLGGEDDELNLALESLLRQRDNNLSDCESLLAGMLASRDQWTRAFPLTGHIDWEDAKRRLEEPFESEIHRVLGRAHALFSSHPALTRELLELANYACNSADLKLDIHLLAGLKELPVATPEFVGHWHCLCALLLTKKKYADWRKRFDVNSGFPTGGGDYKRRMQALVQDLAAIPELLDLLYDIRALPPPSYSEQQWQSLLQIFIILRHAVSELSVVFAEENAVDFVEIGMAALKVLTANASNRAPVGSIRHLLVDEFQDTSRRQHEFLASLLQEWSAKSKDARQRTFFFVGDPMQSIYGFRQAEVELFNVVSKHGLTTGTERLPVKTLQLSTNFRSNAGVVKPLNAMFEQVFPYGAKSEAASVKFLPGSSGNLAEPKGAYQIHPSFIKKIKARDGTQPHAALSAPQQSERWEADEVVDVIRHTLSRIKEAARRNEDFTVAVLARAKNHLTPIAARLRAENIPFRAVELEKLGARQEILDLQSLTRAMLHPMDRIAWLALLRAPWCGLCLRDLHLLCGTDDKRTPRTPVSQQIDERLSLLDQDSQERVGRMLSIVRAAVRGRYRQSSFSSWIERTWQSLGGSACVDEAGYQNAEAYFRMLEPVTLDGIAISDTGMATQLDQLFAAPNPSVSERCGVQLMTMHKAKGLGFNVVLLPSLHRTTGRDGSALVLYLERMIETATELLASPIGNTGEDSSPLQRWVRRQKTNRETEERKRLLYVACTRAKDELHLFATAEVIEGELACPQGSLLATAWPALESVFREKVPPRDAGKNDTLLRFPHEQPERGILDSLAATARQTLISRLPQGWEWKAAGSNLMVGAATDPGTETELSNEQARPEGSRLSRTLGTIVHALLERASHLLEEGKSANELLDDTAGFKRYAAAFARNDGLSPGESDAYVSRAISALESALNDPQGRWILGSHPGAQAEISWTGMVRSIPTTLRIDRSFRAGSQPCDLGEDCVWIVDYKTATPSMSSLAEFLDAERLQYAKQLEGYGQMIRMAHGSDTKLRLALYYPFLKELLWWPG